MLQRIARASMDQLPLPELARKFAARRTKPAGHSRHPQMR